MYVSQRTISALISALIFAAASCLTIAAQNRSHISLPKPATTTSIIPIGSSLTFGGTNVPDTYSATTTFSPTPVLVDNGAVKIWQQQVSDSPNSEWDMFYMQTTGGGPLAGNINADWSIVIDYTLSAPAFFDQVVNQWLVNGTPVSPLTNGIGSICCATTSNPILSGPAYYGSGFSGAFPAGVQSNWQQIFVDPYSLVSSGGIDASTANEFIFALHFTLQQPQPVVQWSLSETHSGSFKQGQTATATIDVKNIGTISSSGLVTVTEIPPTGLTTLNMSGTNWTCSCTNTCTRSDALAAGDSYPPITVTFNVASNAPTSVTDSASVQGGGGALVTATDPTTIAAGTPPSPAPPFGSFDTPADNAVVNGAIPVTGWALSPAGIVSVGIWREPNPGETASPNGLVYIDPADIVAGSRPDVEQLYPSYPGSYQAGWGVEILTNELPSNSGHTGLGNGTYQLHAIAQGNDGKITDLGTKTITVDNASAVLPFGTIDTPVPGGTTSGVIVNFGWALTPQPNIIPIDGSTINVFIDNLPMGHPTYNQPRSDIEMLFPNYQNTDGAVGYYFVDTTKLSNGVHTIAWTARDSVGNAQGLGSRYFTVLNTCPVN